MAQQSITFIGGGNMATSLIGGLLKTGYPPQSIYVTDPLAARRELLAKQFGVHAGDDNEAFTRAADVLVLAVKPQAMREVVMGLAAAAASRQPLVLSIAAGITEPDIRRWLGYEAAVVRTMPNTPALVGSGMTGMVANANVDQRARETADGVMRAVGRTLWLENETDLDAVTAVSGSGPAYFFLLMELMIEAGEGLGLSRDAARTLTIETALGAARMAQESEHEPGTLRENVTSPGGTTAAALAEFESGGIREVVTRALGAARDRGQSLARELGQS